MIKYYIGSKRRERERNSATKNQGRRNIIPWLCTGISGENKAQFAVVVINHGAASSRSIVHMFSSPDDQGQSRVCTL